MPKRRPPPLLLDEALVPTKSLSGNTQVMVKNTFLEFSGTSTALHGLDGALASRNDCGLTTAPASLRQGSWLRECLSTCPSTAVATDPFGPGNSPPSKLGSATLPPISRNSAAGFNSCSLQGLPQTPSTATPTPSSRAYSFGTSPPPAPSLSLAALLADSGGWGSPAEFKPQVSPPLFTPHLPVLSSSPAPGGDLATSAAGDSVAAPAAGLATAPAASSSQAAVSPPSRCGAAPQRANRWADMEDDIDSPVPLSCMESPVRPPTRTTSSTAVNRPPAADAISSGPPLYSAFVAPPLSTAPPPPAHPPTLPPSLAPQFPSPEPPQAPPMHSPDRQIVACVANAPAPKFAPPPAPPQMALYATPAADYSAFQATQQMGQTLQMGLYATPAADYSIFPAPLPAPLMAAY